MALNTIFLGQQAIFNWPSTKKSSFSIQIRSISSSPKTIWNSWTITSHPARWNFWNLIPTLEVHPALPQAGHKVSAYLSPNYSPKAAWTSQWPIGQLKQPWGNNWDWDTCSLYGQPAVMLDVVLMTSKSWKRIISNNMFKTQALIFLDIHTHCASLRCIFVSHPHKIWFSWLLQFGCSR